MSALTKADMIDRLTIRLRITRQDARQIVDKFFEEISQNLADGKEVKISGFGNFELKDKKSRPGRNPRSHSRRVKNSARASRWRMIHASR